MKTEAALLELAGKFNLSEEVMDGLRAALYETVTVVEMVIVTTGRLFSLLIQYRQTQVSALVDLGEQHP